MSYLPNLRLLLVSTALAAATLLALAACGQPSQPPTAVPPTPTAAPPTPTALPRGGNLTLRLAADVPTLRPWQPRARGEEQILGLLYSGLTRLDARLQPQPDLATGWEAAPDGRTITFTLRSGVTWHDGQPLTADDVVFTLDSLRAISPTTALLVNLGRITAVTAPTSTTLVVALAERHAPIFSELAVPVLPRHLLAGRDLAGLDFWEVPVGSGPFKLEAREPGASVTLQRHPGFYRGEALLDRVAFVVAPDAQVAADALVAGQLLGGELPWSTAQAISGTAGLRVGSYVENGYYFVGFNMREGRPFGDPRLRAALAAAVDLPRLLAEATGGQGQAIGGTAAPGSWADLTSVPTTSVDLDLARRLLDEAGWRSATPGDVRQRDGVPLTVQLYVRADDPRRVRAAELIAAQAEQVGMDVVVQAADFETVIRSKYAPPYDFDLLLGSWSNGAADPDFADYAYYDPDDFALLHSSQINQGTADTRPALNFVGFDDPAFDNQAAAARQLYDPAARAQAIRLAQERVAALQPYLFLWADRLPVVLSERVTTLDGPVDLATPLYLWNIERWYLE